jgi:hypothetical protein
VADRCAAFLPAAQTKLAASRHEALRQAPLLLSRHPRGHWGRGVYTRFLAVVCDERTDSAGSFYARFHRMKGGVLDFGVFMAYTVCSDLEY